MSRIVHLRAKLEGRIDDKPCELQPYRARLIQEAGKEVILQVGQPHSTGEIIWGFKWYVKSLIENGSKNILSLDWVQGWDVTGMEEVLKETLEHAKITLK